MEISCEAFIFFEVLSVEVLQGNISHLLFVLVCAAVHFEHAQSLWRIGAQSTLAIADLGLVAFIVLSSITSCS